MGYIRHHAIIITAYKDSLLKKAHVEAERLGLPTSPIVESHVNGYLSFFIAPDGSKEGWEDSNKGDLRRRAFKEWTFMQLSSSLDWIELSYDEDGKVAICATAWDKRNNHENQH